ncbi:MAG TPA: hypothetical protein VFI70_01945 [Nitrososphaeraceae archaeon]|nr:hypothetical protein [Nitrososphaeraceae archaeon]
MDEVTCPICGITIQPEEDRKEHLETHKLTNPHMQKIALHLIKVEERLNALEKSKGYEVIQKKARLGDGSNIAAEDR